MKDLKEGLRKIRCQHCSKEIEEKDTYCLEIMSCCHVYTLKLCKQCYDKFSDKKKNSCFNCC